MKKKGFLILSFLVLSLTGYGQETEKQGAIDNCLSLIHI